MAAILIFLNNLIEIVIPETVQIDTEFTKIGSYGLNLEQKMSENWLKSKKGPLGPLKVNLKNGNNFFFNLWVIKSSLSPVAKNLAKMHTNFKILT